MSSRVEKRFRAGALSATVFVREVGKGDAKREFASVQLQRAYKGPDGRFYYTANLRSEHLLEAAALLQRAYEFLVFRTDESR